TARAAAPAPSGGRGAPRSAPSARAPWRTRSRSAAGARRISSASERPRERRSSITVSRPMSIASGTRHFGEQLESEHEAEDDDRLGEGHQDQPPPAQLGLFGHRPYGRATDD